MGADVLIGSHGRVFRYARLVAGGDDEESVGFESWLQFLWNRFVEGTCKGEDDVALALK